MYSLDLDIKKEISSVSRFRNQKENDSYLPSSNKDMRGITTLITLETHDFASLDLEIKKNYQYHDLESKKENTHTYLLLMETLE